MHYHSTIMCAKWTIHLIFCYLIISVILVEEYKFWSSSLCSVSPTCYHFISLSSKLFSSAPCSQTSSVCVPPLISEIKFHTIRNHWQNYVLYISRLNGSKHYQNSFSSKFHPELNFDSLLVFPNIWTMPHFKKICFLSDFTQYSGDSNVY
jgi:hypothetical protein